MATENGRGSFGFLLLRHRMAAGLSQQELAERAGLSRRGVSDLERGFRRSPYPATVRRLAEALALGEAERVALRAAARTRTDATQPIPQGRRGNLPLALTTFVGRGPELIRLQA